MYDEIMINISVDLAYLQTSEMTADVLSKPLCGEKFSTRIISSLILMYVLLIITFLSSISK